MDKEIKFDFVLILGLIPGLFSFLWLITIGKANLFSNFMLLVASLTLFFIIADIGNILNKNLE